MKNHVPTMQQAMPVIPDASGSFLFGRQQVIHLVPLEPSQHPAYIWRKIFLKDKRNS